MTEIDHEFPATLPRMPRWVRYLLVAFVGVWFFVGLFLLSFMVDHLRSPHELEIGIGVALLDNDLYTIGLPADPSHYPLHVRNRANHDVELLIVYSPPLTIDGEHTGQIKAHAELEITRDSAGNYYTRPAGH